MKTLRLYYDVSKNRIYTNTHKKIELTVGDVVLQKGRKPENAELSTLVVAAFVSRASAILGAPFQFLNLQRGS